MTIKGHCHGCNGYTTQTVVIKTNSPAMCVCNHCSFQNNGHHNVEETGDKTYRYLECLDCREVITLKR